MKVGDYVRTKGSCYVGSVLEYLNVPRIDRIINFDKDGFFHLEQDPSDSIYCKKDIIKSSPNIIDLIKVGDFITYRQGNIYWDIPERVSGRYNRQNEQTDLIVNGTPLEHLEILSIVTKEQFESMEYKVGE